MIDGEYLIVTAVVKEHYLSGRRAAGSVSVENVAVCNNHCLGELLGIKGY